MVRFDFGDWAVFMIIFFFLSNVKRKRGSILMDSAGTEMWAPSGRD